MSDLGDLVRHVYCDSVRDALNADASPMWCVLGVPVGLDWAAGLLLTMEPRPSLHCVDRHTDVRARTRNERFLSWPWRPWVDTVTTHRHVPAQRLFLWNGDLWGHPETIAKLERRAA